MNNIIFDEDVIERDATVQKIVAQRNTNLIGLAVETYKRDLPELIAENYLNHFVAYSGSVRIAIEPTREKLNSILEQKGFTNKGDVFTTYVFPLTTDKSSGFDR